VKTTVDWLRFRCKLNPFELFELVRPAFGSTAELLVLNQGAKPRDGWLCAASLSLPDTPIARIDYGGDSQRGWVRFDMPGSGCEWVQDWDYLERVFGALKEAEITRIDIAFTAADPDLVSDDVVMAAFDAGKFCAGGRPPVMRSVTSSDPCAGKTRYIGKRENHKFLRCYEKGWQLLKDLRDCDQWIKKPGLLLPMDGVGDVPIEHLYRVELELKAVDKFIPWTVISGRDDVFASAYPFCAELIPKGRHFVMSELPSFKPKAALKQALANMTRAYGGVLRAAFEAYGGDELAMRRLMRECMAAEPSKRLVESGVLTVDHEPVL